MQHYLVVRIDDPDLDGPDPDICIIEANDALEARKLFISVQGLENEILSFGVVEVMKKYMFQKMGKQIIH